MSEVINNNHDEWLINRIKSMGFSVTVDTNPSPEKIARIKASIERNRKRYPLAYMERTKKPRVI